MSSNVICSVLRVLFVYSASVEYNVCIWQSLIATQTCMLLQLSNFVMLPVRLYTPCLTQRGAALVIPTNSSAIFIGDAIEYCLMLANGQ